MYDFHMHTTVSYDGHGSPEQMAAAAKKAGLREICFTDHRDYMPGVEKQTLCFDLQAYRDAYDRLSYPGLIIRRGAECSLLPDNQRLMREDLQRYPYDFILGSVHLVDGEDVYYAPYWQGKQTEAVYRRYLEQTLACVEAHEDFDVLAHLTYICKCRGNPTHAPLYYTDYPKLADAILTALIRKDKGLEVNTSGVDRCGTFLPEAGFVRRFRELGGRIVTVGSDAHNYDRVGQYNAQAPDMLREIFGYVCTFTGREPVFHRL